jgi:Uma2 family endonuclease
MTELVDRLERRYRARDDVYVAANNLVYYVEGDPFKSFSPDVYVVFGVPKGKRRVYKVWEEGEPPTATFEMTSRSTRREDKGEKMAKCARIGVREYWLFDPELDYLKPALQGYRLRAGRYEPIEPEADGGLPSEVLGLTLRLDGSRLVLHDTGTGEPVPTAAEAAEAERRAARSAQEAAESAQRAEREARMRAEAENARLQAELERLRGGVGRIGASEDDNAES